MVTKEISVDNDLTTRTTQTTNNEISNLIRRISSSSNNEIFINEGFRTESDTCFINMDSSNNDSIFESEQSSKDLEPKEEINQNYFIQIATTTKNDNKNNHLMVKNDQFLATNLNNLETVSFSELDEVKFQKKLSVYYKTKFKKFQNKFSHNKNSFMQRLVNKNGEANINRINIASRHRKYISDIFNTIVDLKWRYILGIFLFSFVASWGFFGILWFLIIYFSKDVCISNVDKTSFLNSLFESFVFSIETQQTIGYGYRYITESCKFSMLILMIQCAFSVLLESFLGGVIFAKLSRPKKRTETLVFSNQAVIAPRDGVYNLMVRVGDLRKSHIILAHVRMYLVRSRFTTEGEYIPCEIQELPVINLNSSDLLLFMPIIVAHKIDQMSPLYEIIAFNKSDTKIYADEFLFNDFEILVTLEGTVESTGASTQARTSFLPSEIIWNHVFEPLISVSANNSKATIDFSLFNNTTKIETLKNSLKSSRKLSFFNSYFKRNSNEENLKKKINRNNNNNNSKLSNKNAKKLSVPLISLSKLFEKQDSKFQLV